MQEGVLDKNQSYFCDGMYEYGNNKYVKCHQHNPYVNLKTSLATSCNPYFCNLWENYFDSFDNIYKAYENWENHVKSFGFGDYLDNDFISGTKGFIPGSEYYDRYYKKNRWKSSTILSMSIGQGELLSTPIQMANLAATIANKGFYFTPHIIKKIDGDSIPSKFQKKKYTSIAPKHFNSVIEGMELTLTHIDGTANLANRIEGINICGKTGTAQNPHGEDHSIFIAFAQKKTLRLQLLFMLKMEDGVRLGPHQLLH